MKRHSLAALALAFTQIGLSSVGGAAAPIRHVLVVRRRWLTEAELGETFAVAQALPGASAANLAVMLGDRFGGTLGPLATVGGLSVPSLAVALILVVVATHLSAANARFAAAETGVTAAVAGLFISNGIRLARRLWSDAPELRLRWRGARAAISLGAIVLVAGLHFFIPAVLVGLAFASFGIELALRRSTAS